MAAVGVVLSVAPTNKVSSTAEDTRLGDSALRTQSPGSPFWREVLGVVTGVPTGASCLVPTGIIASMDIMMPRDDAKSIANHSKTGGLKAVMSPNLNRISVWYLSDRKHDEEATGRDATGTTAIFCGCKEVDSDTSHSFLLIPGNLWPPTRESADTGSITRTYKNVRLYQTEHCS